MKKKVIVLGGGASGLGVAWKLAEKKVPVEVIELRNEIGGLAATVRKDDYYLDYGPHYFLSEKAEIIKKVTSLFKQDFGKDMPLLRRDARLLFRGKFLNYPLNIRNILFEIPFTESLLIVSSYFLRQFLESVKKLFKKDAPDKNFEVWARKNFGDYLFKIFFKPYTEQFWGIQCNKLAPRTLPTNTRLSFFKALKLVFHKKITKKGASLAEREMTLILRYPFKGIGMVLSAIAHKIKKLGNKVHMGYEVRKIKRNYNGTFTVIAIKKGRQKEFHADFLISTIPITLTIRMLEPPAPEDVLESSKKLGFLSFMVLYIVIPNRNVLSSSYLYFVGRPYNRISEMKKFSPYLCPKNENMVAVEISCLDTEQIWGYSKEQVLEMCIKFLEKDNIIKRKEIKKTFLLKARYAYPIYYHDHEPHLNRVLDYLKTIPDFEVTGRVGKYLYVDIDQCLTNSFALVDEIMPKLKIKHKKQKLFK